MSEHAPFLPPWKHDEESPRDGASSKAIMHLGHMSVAALVVCVFALPPAVMAVWPSDGTSLVVLGGKDPLVAVVEAGGSLVSSADADRAIVTRAPEHAREGFVAKLLGAGAGIVLASPDDVGCRVDPPRSFSSPHGAKE